MLYCILDIDGTLADISHRAHLIEGPKKDWDKFFDPSLVSKDSPIKLAQAFEKIVDLTDMKIILLTGRPERLQQVTIDWLKKYYPKYASAELVMRADDNYSPASEYKTRAFVNDVLWDPNVSDEDTFIFIDDEPAILYVFSHYGLSLKAPECWELMVHPKPAEKEPVLK